MLRVVSFLKGQRKPNWEEGGERKKKRQGGGEERDRREKAETATHIIVYITLTIISTNVTYEF